MWLATSFTELADWPSLTKFLLWIDYYIIFPVDLSLPIIFFPACVVYMFCVFACAWMSELDIRCLFKPFSFYEAGSLTELGTCWLQLSSWLQLKLARFAGQQAPEILLSLFPMSWGYRCVSLACFLCGWWGIELRSFCLCGKILTEQSQLSFLVKLEECSINCTIFAMY